MKKILLLAGDGIGVEIMREAEKIIAILQRDAQLQLQILRADIGGCAVDNCATPFPEETSRLAKESAAILLGAVGGTKWDNLPRAMRPESGLLALRGQLQLFANLRPIKVWQQLAQYSPLKPQLLQNLDMLIVRELTGGIYFGQPRGYVDDAHCRAAFNTMRYDENEIRRIAKVAFKAAAERKGRLCSVDKMNVLECSQLWREVICEVAKDYPQVTLTHLLVDNAAMQLIRRPNSFDVIVTSNLFGDILSDEASQLAGSIGMLPSASLRDDGVGLYEPIHGSAPDIAGKNIANPLAMILSVAMMLRYSFKNETLAALLESAVDDVICAGWRCADIAENGDKILTTEEMGSAVGDCLQKRLQR